MKLKRVLAVAAALAIVGTSLTLVTAGTASAAGRPGKLEVVGPCGDLLDLIERVQGTLIVDVTIPSVDSTEVWNLTAQEQEYNPVTGGRQGNPINLVPNPLPQLAFSPAEGGFSSTFNFVDTPGATHGFTYTATRTSPTFESCTNTGYFTHPSTGPGPDPTNPTSRPDSPPALTGNTEADSAGHDVLLQFDQEMLATAQGIPPASRFNVLVNGVARTVTGTTVTNDSPPADAVVDLTLSGVALKAGQTVSIQYRKQLTTNLPQFQDPENNQTANFGPVSVPVF
jgi:hypothetical protein